MKEPAVVDFAKKMPCPRCKKPVRVFFSALVPTGPWWCPTCLKEKIAAAIEGRPFK